MATVQFGDVLYGIWETLHHWKLLLTYSPGSGRYAIDIAVMRDNPHRMNDKRIKHPPRYGERMWVMVDGTEVHSSDIHHVDSAGRYGYV